MGLLTTLQHLDIPKPVIDKPIFEHKSPFVDVPWPRQIPWWVGPDPEGLLPLILSMPHQFNTNLSKEETKKLSIEAYDAMIQQAQYQVEMLNAQVSALTKQRDQLREKSENE